MQLVPIASKATQPPPNRFLRLADVEHLTGLKKSTIYTLLRDKESGFPKPIKLTGRAVAWSEAAVQQWIQTRLEA